MTYETAKPKPKALLVGIIAPQTTDAENEESLAELGRLASTLGFAVVKSLSQRRRSLSGSSVVGQGKLKELARWTGGRGVVEKWSASKKGKVEDVEEDEEENEEDGEVVERVDAVIFDCELTPSQLGNLHSALAVEILDRTGVIVEIFSRHARTREAKLQVEIARLKYLAPRLRKSGSQSSERMNKAGETSLELDKRRIRDRISELKEEILAVQKDQSVGRSQRAEQRCVALVGYTNAGKSSLMRALTGSQVLVEDKLFATLETTVRTLVPETTPRILISDTVGFIRKLPHDLVASFRSTLEEAKNAWLLLYVVDASDPSFRSQLQVTKEVLSSLEIVDVPWRLVLNKCDRVEDPKALQREFPEAILLSAKEPAQVAGLRQRLIEFFEEGMSEEEVFIPYTAQQGVGRLRSLVTVVSERYSDEGTFYLVRGHNLEQLRAGLP
ncbi:GTPase HflX [bacterium]|nr:GTPase HflX [bacterium]